MSYQLPLYPNLQLITTVVQFLMKTRNNALARQQFVISNWLTQVVIYPKTMQAYCCEHWTEVLYFHVAMSFNCNCVQWMRLCIQGQHLNSNVIRNLQDRSLLEYGQLQGFMEVTRLHLAMVTTLRALAASGFLEWVQHAGQCLAAAKIVNGCYRGNDMWVIDADVPGILINATLWVS